MGALFKSLETGHKRKSMIYYPSSSTCQVKAQKHSKCALLWRVKYAKVSNMGLSTPQAKKAKGK